MISKWNILIAVSLIIAVILLIVHYLTGNSWEPIVAVLITAIVGLWKEQSETKRDVAVIRTDIKHIKEKLL